MTGVAEGARGGKCVAERVVLSLGRRRLLSDVMIFETNFGRSTRRGKQGPDGSVQTRTIVIKKLRTI